jgi:hypothetical protein
MLFYTRAFAAAMVARVVEEFEFPKTGWARIWVQWPADDRTCKS